MTIEYPSQSWKDYELIDSGRGAKLERFGDFIMARPEPKALWDKSMTDLEWNRLCHTRFTPGAGFGKAGKEDSGIWERLRKMPDQWWISYSGGPSFRLRLGLTSFKHVGVFPGAGSELGIYLPRDLRDCHRDRKGSQGAEPLCLHRSGISGRKSCRS